MALALPPAPNFGDYDKIIKLVGLAGTSISFLKAAVIYLADHSRDRKARKIGDEIDKDLARLARLDNQKIALPSSDLDLYKTQINEDLQSHFHALQRVRAITLRRALSKNADPTGLARWLLLYKPVGINGWFVHTLYYCTLLFLVMFLFDVTVVPIFDREVRAEPEFLAAMVWGFVLSLLLALYLRGISLRLKIVRNAMCLHAIPHPNSDLHRLRRFFLLFKRRDGYWLLRILFWFCVGVIAAAPWLIDSDDSTLFTFFAVMGYVVMAWLFRTDALSRRAKKLLPGLLASAQHPFPPPANVPATIPAATA